MTRSVHLELIIHDQTELAGCTQETPFVHIRNASFRLMFGIVALAADQITRMTA